MHWQVHKIQSWRVLKYLRVWISHSSEIPYCRKSLGSPVGQGEFEPAMCPHGKEAQLHPRGVLRKSKGCDSSPPLSSEKEHLEAYSGLHTKDMNLPEELWRYLRDRSTWHMKRGWDRWVCYLGEEKAPGESSPYLTGVSKKDKEQCLSSQWYSVREQKVTAELEYIKLHLYIKKKAFFLMNFRSLEPHLHICNRRDGIFSPSTGV